MIAFKGLAWTISLASFRGGPVFPALFLGAAAGLLASHLAGFDQTAAVAVGGRRHRVRPWAAAVGGRARDAPDREQRRGRHSTNNCRSGRRIPHDAGVVPAGRACAPARPRARMPEPQPKTRSTGGSTAG